MAFTQRHLLGLEGVPATEIIAILDTAASFKEISERDIKKVPTLRGKTVDQPLLRGQHAHPDVVRDRRQAAVGRHHQHQRVDLEHQQGRDARRHGAQPRGHAARRDRRPPPVVGRAAPPRAPRRPARSSTPATAATSTRRRRCSTCSPSASTAASIAGLTVAIVGDLLHSRVGALEPARAAHARRARAPGRPADAAAAASSPRSAPSCTTTCADGVRDADVIMMLRIQRERQGANFFPTLDEYSQLLLPHRGRRAARASPQVIILHPGPDEPRPRDRERRRRRPVLGDHGPGDQRRRRAHGAPLPAGRAQQGRGRAPRRRARVAGAGAAAERECARERAALADRGGTRRRPGRRHGRRRATC